MTKDEMIGWHHPHNRYEFEQTLEMVKDRAAWRAAVREVAESVWTEGFNNNKVNGP